MYVAMHWRSIRMSDSEFEPDISRQHRYTSLRTAPLSGPGNVGSVTSFAHQQ
jgi:hypothetical protein